MASNNCFIPKHSCFHKTSTIISCFDTILIGFAEILQKQVREIDIVGRSGGEKSLIIFPGTLMLLSTVFDPLHPDIMSRFFKIISSMVQGQGDILTLILEM